MAHLTAGQYATLKTYIESNATWMAYLHTADGAFQISDDLKAQSTSFVWRSNLTETEITSSVSSEGTTWSWPLFISRSPGEQAGYARMFLTGVVDAGSANVRQGFVDIFSGGTGSAQRTHMAAIAKRPANLLEALFAVGVGTLASPAVLVIEGSLGHTEILQAMGW